MVHLTFDSNGVGEGATFKVAIVKRSKQCISVCDTVGKAPHTHYSAAVTTSLSLSDTGMPRLANTDEGIFFLAS